MSPAKIVRIVSLIAVLVIALVPGIPQAALILALLGLVVGYFVAPDNRITLFLLVIVLASGAAGALNSIPVIGVYLTAILTNMGALLAAACVTVITMVVYERITED